MKAVLLLAMIAFPHRVEDRVDAIELNHVADSFSQWIFWEFDRGQWLVVDWRFSKNATLLGRRGDDWILILNDRWVSREIVAKRYWVTNTRIDREVENRKTCSPGKRRGLSRGQGEVPGR